MIFFDFSSDKLSFVLGIFSFFYNQLFFGTFWKSNIISLYLCLFENFLYFFEVLYTLFILEYRLLILTVVVSTLTILHKIECNFFWFPLNFSKASTTRRFFNGNGCFDILTVHFFINIKQKYLPNMLNMEIKTRNIWMFLKMVLNSMYMWTSYKEFPSLKKNEYVLNAHETKPYKTNKEKPHYCCSSSWNHCKPSTMKLNMHTMQKIPDVAYN
jgi:hypothetical protein